MKQAPIAALWREAGLDPHALDRLTLTGHAPVLASSFLVAEAAQTSIAAAALAASEIHRLQGRAEQLISVDLRHAALECFTYFAVNGVVPEAWDRFSGVYRARDGWVRIHANFAHHRDGALALLGLRADEATTKVEINSALQSWSAIDFESAAASQGLAVTALRSRAAWCAHPQYAALQTEPLIALERIGDDVDTRTLFLKTSDAAASRPLAGLRVLDLTRILAGPICGRALAAYGADVLLINAPHLPNIEAIADTSRGKRSAHCDLRSAAGREAMIALIRDAHVFVQSYRPGGLDALGFSAAEVAKINPRVIYVSLSAFGFTGPWAQRRGFDSLVQTATGFNDDESCAAGIDLLHSPPRALPMQILDHATGYLMAFAAQVALLRQQREGGAWHVKLSLARTGEWIRNLGRQALIADLPPPDFSPYLYTEASGFGALTALRHSAVFSHTPARWDLPSMPPGSHSGDWR